MKEGIGMSWIELGCLVAGPLQTRWQRLRAVHTGQSTVEYALVGALVIIAAAGALTLLGSQLSSVFGHITATLGGPGGAH
jgi:Flp pilus assembly pilin Flp